MHECNKERCHSSELDPNMFSDSDNDAVGHLVYRDEGSCIISEISVTCDEIEFSFKSCKQIKDA